MKKIPFILTGLVLLASLWGCSDDNGWSANGTIDTGKEIILTLDLRVPGINSPATYALSKENEHKLKDLDILVFKENDGEEKTFLYRTHATEIDNSSGNTNKKFRAQLQKSTGADKHRIVLIANARVAVDAAIETITVGMEKDVALGKITFATNGAWNTSSENFTLLPMWGQTEDAHIITTSTTATSLKPINLLRSVARIDVGLNMLKVDEDTDELRGLSNFKMEEVRVYNANSLSAVAPLETNLTVNAAALPTAAFPTLVTTPSPEQVMITYEHDPNDFGLVREIYVGEADNKTQTDDNDMMCLVVGGYYAKVGEVNTSEKTWYRIDFYKKKGETDIEQSNPQERLDILRNHRYRVNITSVSGPGYGSQEEALSSIPVNMETTVIKWDESEINAVATDGKYMLGVSQMEYNLAMDKYEAGGSDNQLTITTDHPDGWNISIIYDDAIGMAADWLGVTANNGKGQQTVSLLLNPNDSGADRSAKVNVTAGSITLVVQVNQSQVPDLGLSIKDENGNEISELLFYAPTDFEPDPQDLTVSWAPNSGVCTITSDAVEGIAFDYGSGAKFGFGGITGTTSGSSPQTFTIKPPAITKDDLTDHDNSFLRRMSKVNFTITNGISYMSKSIYLRQVNYALTTSGISSFYTLNGGVYTFNVKSNATWRIQSVTETVTSGSGALLNNGTNDNLEYGTTGGNNIITGNDISFTVADNISSLAGTVTVVFESTDSPKKFEDVSVTLTLMGEYYPAAHSGWAGSNIYWKDGELTFDDVNSTTQTTGVQGVYFQWGSLWGISPMSAWSTGAVILYPPSESGLASSGTATSLNRATWSNWPRVDDASITSTSGKDVRDRGYLYEITDGNAGIGDICKYLTEKAGGKLHEKKWRMPTSNEFEAVANYTSRGSYGSTTSSEADGTQPFNSGKTKTTDVGTPFFPAAGYRDNNKGPLFNVGMYGYYWSASPIDTEGYCMYFNSNTVTPSNNSNRADAFSVRCVAE